MAAGAAEEAGVDGVLELGGFAVEDVAGLAEAATDDGTGVDDDTGAGKDEAGGVAPTLAVCAVGLATAWAQTLRVKRLRALRIKETLFISKVILNMIAKSGPAAKPHVFSSQRVS
ncbi:MAG: hypothetical protein ND895_02060 [Pyrinomonadaceae bacterium]|nr:hypothetical protein [Pyrinomonadaceae bacterium]